MSSSDHTRNARRGRRVARVAAAAMAGAVLVSCTGVEAVSNAIGDGDASVEAADPAAITLAGFTGDAVFNAEELAAAEIVVTAAAPADTVAVTIDDQALVGPDARDGDDEAGADDEPAADDETAADDEAGGAGADTEGVVVSEQDDITTVTLSGPVLADLADGDHVLAVTAGSDGLFSSPATDRQTFAVDTTAPSLEVAEPIEATDLAAPLTITFDADDDATVTSADGSVDAGAGTMTWDTPPTEVVLTAMDAAGNATEVSAPVVVVHPGMRAVHTTPLAWQYEPKRTAIVELVEAGLIDTIQLDVKDEAGDVGFDSDVDLANQSGADDDHDAFDAAAAVAEMHDMGVRVVGRLVVYKDPILAQWAWENGRRDWVTQTTAGEPFTGSYGEFAFTNPAHPEVQQYNVDIALEAADMGFDEILYDYIRRPDGSLDSMVFPGIGDRTPEEAVVEMMATAYPQLRERGVWVGASVFGIAVTRPTEIAQDIPAMAPYVDYVAPMVYPDHWGPGEYDLSNPTDSPYEIVQRSLADFHEVLEPTGTLVIPWLAAFKVSGDASVGYVRDQIEATVDATGHQSFLLWNPGANYDADTLDPIQRDG